MNYTKPLKEAIELNRKLSENMQLSPEVIDFQLQKRARELHDFFYTLAPWHWFHVYVREVHDALQRPNWLCGRPGVDQRLLQEIELERLKEIARL
jgi:hypothetical protein